MRPPGAWRANPRGRGRKTRRASGRKYLARLSEGGLVMVARRIAGPWLCFPHSVARDRHIRSSPKRTTHASPHRNDLTAHALSAILIPASGGCRLDRLARPCEPDDCRPRTDPPRTHKAATSCARTSDFHFALRFGFHFSNPSFRNHHLMRDTLPAEAVEVNGISQQMLECVGKKHLLWV